MQSLSFLWTWLWERLTWGRILCRLLNCLFGNQDQPNSSFAPIFAISHVHFLRVDFPVGSVTLSIFSSSLVISTSSVEVRSVLKFSLTNTLIWIHRTSLTQIESDQRNDHSRVVSLWSCVTVSSPCADNLLNSQFVPCTSSTLLCLCST
jgi:hypothetical protein